MDSTCTAILCLVTLGVVTGNPVRNRTTTTITSAFTTLPPVVGRVTGNAEPSWNPGPEGARLARCLENITTSAVRENAVRQMIVSMCQQYEPILRCADKVLKDFSDNGKKNTGILGLSAVLFDLDSSLNSYRDFCAQLPLVEDSLICLTDNFGFDSCSHFIVEPVRRAPDLDMEEAKTVYCRGYVDFVNCVRPGWDVCGTANADIFENLYRQSLPPACRQLTRGSPHNTDSRPQVSIL